MKELKIRFNPTGNVFVLPEEEALRIYREPGNNYTILDDDFVDEEPKEEETTVYKQIVEEEENEAVGEQTEAAELEALKKEADELGVKYGKTIGIDTLRKRIEEFKAQ